MRHLACAAAVLLTGCATSPPATNETTTPTTAGLAWQVTAAEDPSTGPSVSAPRERDAAPGPPPAARDNDGDPGPATRQSADGDGPTAAAVDAVTAGLHAQGLDVLDLDAELVEEGDGTAAVEVTASHDVGRGHPHQSSYELHLIDEDGRWTVAGWRARP